MFGGFLLYMYAYSLLLCLLTIPFVRRVEFFIVLVNCAVTVLLLNVMMMFYLWRSFFIFDLP